MSPSDPRRVEVAITALDRFTEIGVIDAGLQPVLRLTQDRCEVLREGAATVQPLPGRGDPGAAWTAIARLSPGLYRIRFASPGAHEVRDVVVRPGPRLAVQQGQALEVPTPSPVEQGAFTHEYQGEGARDVSRGPFAAELPGADAEIVVFARDPRGTARPDTSANPVRGLVLCDVRGTPLVALETAGRVHAGQGWAGARVRVPAGVHRLRLAAEGGPLEQMVYAFGGWQTQVFLLGGEGDAAAHFAGASVAIVRSGLGFDRAIPDFRYAEIARAALRARDPRLADAVLDAMLMGKFENPMLGIYGAHLLQLRESFDRALVETVLGNLTRLVPSLPDLRALSLAFARRGVTVPAFAHAAPLPPVLLESWRLLVAASAEDAAVLPEGSLSVQIAGRLVGDGPGLCWRVPEAATTKVVRRAFAPMMGFAAASAVDANAAITRVSAFGRAVAGGEGPRRPVEAFATRHRLSALEQAVLWQLVPADPDAPVEPPTVAELVKAVGRPRAAVVAALGALAEATPEPAGARPDAVGPAGGRATMKLMAFGIEHGTGKRLYPTVDEDTFAAALVKGLASNIDALRGLAGTTVRGARFRAEVERRPSVDPSDPRAAGWTFLVAKEDPRRDALVAALRPLAEHRGMKDPARPLVLSKEDDWYEWLEDNYFGQWLEGTPPHHVLLVGGPDLIPFRFQSILDSAASVGRLDFDDVEAFATYARKVVALEQAASPVADREAVFFAPDYGPDDPTWFSREYLAQPLASWVRDDRRVPVRALLGDEATKPALLAALRGRRPALVFTASHGMAAPGAPLGEQRRVTGAICCQRRADEPEEAWLFTADDVPDREPFLEGAVFFQFACFGYGTPAESDFAHWLPEEGWAPKRIAAADFVSALPRRLLAHPRGPIGFVGHLDTAWLHGFDDPRAPIVADRWHERIVPFKRAVEQLVGVDAVGVAMGDMNKRYDIANARLMDFFDRRQRGKIEITPEVQARITDAFVFRGDAQNYMVFGDPAVHLRIPA